MSIVRLTSHKEWLTVSPVIPELLEDLKFYHRFNETTEKTWYDRTEGKMVTRKVRGGYTGRYELLYTLSEDGTFFVTYNGLKMRICDQLAVLGYETTYQRIEFPWVVPEINKHTMRGLYPEQLKFAISLLVAGNSMGEGATAVGKTHIIAALIRAYWRNANKILIVTDSQSVVRSLVRELNDILKEDGIQVGITQGSLLAPAKVTVSTTKMMYVHEPDDISMICYDECHGAAAAEASSFLQQFGRAVKHGLSGTISGRSDGKEKFLEAMFGPTIAEISDQEAEELGRVAPQHVYAVSVPKGPLKHYTSDITKERHGIWMNSCRNEIIKKVCEKAPMDKQMLIFVRTIEHLEHLVKEGYLSKDFQTLHGQMREKEREQIEKAFVNGEILRLAATDCVKQGINTKNLSIMVDANWITSRTGTMQRRGRNRRTMTGKNFGVIIVFQDEWMTLNHEKELELAKMEELAIGAPEEDDFKDLYKSKADARLRRYKSAGDIITKVGSVDEICFTEDKISEGDLFAS